MNIDEKQLARILVDHTEGASNVQLTKITKDFVKFLSENNLLSQWRNIERAIESAFKEKYGASSVKILSAYPITDTLRDHIKSIAPGAELEERVDQRIIGGAIIRVDDTRIDGSILGTLRRLKSALT